MENRYTTDETQLIYDNINKTFEDSQYICDVLNNLEQCPSKEQIILQNVDPKYKWIARDEDGDLNIYVNKPRKRINLPVWDTTDEYKRFSMFNHLFQNIQFTDKEPTKIKELL